jgi:hypothetical protein
MWENPDLAPFSAGADDDKAKIMEHGRAVPCRVCETIFGRLRLTVRYCNMCHRGFCEGEHGAFVLRGGAVCVRCYSSSSL